MDLREKMQQISDLMQRMKTDWVRHNPEQTDMMLFVHFYRGDEMVVAVASPDRDRALEAAHIGAAGFSADTTLVTFDSYHTTLEVSPITGKEWEPGEMQQLMTEDPDAAEKGWVTECITTLAHERGGAHAMTTLPYLIKEGEVVWHDQVTPPEEAGGGGFMYDALQYSMSQPTLMELAEKEALTDPVAEMALGLIPDPERRQFHTDMATFKAMQERQLIVSAAFSAEPGSDRQQWLQERLDQQDET